MGPALALPVVPPAAVEVVPPAAVERLRHRSAVAAVFAGGRAAHGTAMAVHVIARADSGTPRATVSAGRKVGGAVARNRAKRRLRAALRFVGAAPGVDVVVVAKPAALTLSYERLVNELQLLLDRALRRVRRAREPAGGGADEAGSVRPAREPASSREAERAVEMPPSPLALALLGVLWLYRAVPKGPLPRCRFYPSCSAYAVDAVRRHGALRGALLAVRRLGRCHPWNPGGVDHVPPVAAATARSRRRKEPCCA